jgi:NhaP-type Na+/H+ or K+/H+ antiporter
VLLLPVGFVAGAATDDVHPDVLFGDTFQPLVSLGVGLILFEAGLRLRLQELRGGVRPVVLRLITVGTLVTGAGVTLAVKLIFGLDWGVSVVLRRDPGRVGTDGRAAAARLRATPPTP